MQTHAMADLALLRTSGHAGAVAPVTAEPRRGGRSGRPGSAQKPTSRFVGDHVAPREMRRRLRRRALPLLLALFLRWRPPLALLPVPALLLRQLQPGVLLRRGRSRSRSTLLALLLLRTSPLLLLPPLPPRFLTTARALADNKGLARRIQLLPLALGQEVLAGAPVVPLPSRPRSLAAATSAAVAAAAVDSVAAVAAAIAVAPAVLAAAVVVVAPAVVLAAAADNGAAAAAAGTAVVFAAMAAAAGNGGAAGGADAATTLGTDFAAAAVLVSAVLEARLHSRLPLSLTLQSRRSSGFVSRRFLFSARSGSAASC